MANSNNPFVSFIVQLLNIFCLGGNKQNQQQQQQQQYGQYPSQQQQQQYPPVQQQYPQQQQHQYQPQQQQYQPQPQQQTWSQVAGGQNGQHQSHADQQHHPQHDQQQQQQYTTNGYAPSKMQIPAGGVVGPHHEYYQNQDMINATNDQYEQMRNQARHEGDEAHRCFAQSQQAYQSGDGERAHELSMEGKQHQQRQDELDDQASQWIFNANNNASPPNTIDLHGLYVKEAIERTEQAINRGQQQGVQEIRVIVGKGIHSQGHVAKIKPAVEDLMRKYNLSARIDPQNAGVLIVDLTGSEQGPRSRDAGGLVDQMGKEAGSDCTIM
ncbi:hypothetical protein BCR39DRAFT_559388 [Naematelia encephala]|uniref:Smr domain-containing protein n=1 Tax=Naematelia encephala TaxID=71784 RepID=A0A1Y2B257_9TREE|nr:hypothetical protein BCR39DRAFT_559388 [Naematelia encephala]